MNTVGEIGAVISKLRKSKGVTQEELAKHVGVSAQAVSKWENGGVPDTELLPKIADYFKVSIDNLFDRSINTSSLQSALIESIYNESESNRFHRVLDYCWDMERALMPHNFVVDYSETLEENNRGIENGDQCYSQILNNEGFTLMGLGKRSRYFLVVPNPNDTDAAYLNGINYPEFFKDFSDEKVFNACIMLNKRNAEKAFTENLLVKKLGVTPEQSKTILGVLRKYKLVYTSQIEMDDEIKTVFHFHPTPAFVALLIFAREMIDRPNSYCYNCSYRKKPYL